MKAPGELQLLLLEDDEDHAFLMRHSLGHQGITEIIQARTLAEACRLASEEDFDLLLVDLALPDGNGEEVIRAMQEQRPDVPIVVITSNRAPETGPAALRAGATDFLIKGEASPREVFRIVRFAVERHHQVNRILELTHQLEAANARLAQQAQTDPVTELPNRRRFDSSIAAEWRRAKRLEVPISLILLDIDRFKSINDTRGHAAGDEALRAIAEVLQSAARREVDLPARLGGDEFAVVLAGSDLATTETVAETILDGVRKLETPSTLSVSLGLACHRPAGSDHFETLIEEADAALYRAKKEGGDRLVVAGGDAR